MRGDLCARGTRTGEGVGRKISGSNLRPQRDETRYSLSTAIEQDTEIHVPGAHTSEPSHGPLRDKDEAISEHGVLHSLKPEQD